ncbi:DUF58 domain-containing protein [Alteromonas sp. BMJM2]|uniref:DUF58 domain-containing protein n=1 Tax=Alteromonas sp. BMJM2 TaxID=2954241 RepID=UPI0022B4F67F|nr:DUF58 domain-containing protein [Alteromonas sp. BMJM2]
MISLFGRALIERLSNRWLSLVHRWLDKRIPPASQHSLTMNTIFVLPTGFGWAFIIMSLCLFLLGTNYQNNLMVLLSYILLSVMLLTLFYTHQNFARLMVKSKPLAPFHCHQTGFFHLAVVPQDESDYSDSLSQVIRSSNTQSDFPSSKRCKGNIVASWFGHKAQFPFILDAAESNGAENTTQILTIPIPQTRRGLFSLPRLTLACDYPLGLYKCWTHLDFSAETVVYAKPLKGDVNTVSALNDESEQSTHSTSMTNQNGSDFHSLSDYKAGEPLNRVVWKQVAKSGDWVVKAFEEPEQRNHVLSVDTNVETETAISLLTFHVIEQSKQGNLFGIQYQSIDIKPSSGETHTHQCLKALACLHNGGSPFEKKANTFNAVHSRKVNKTKKRSKVNKSASS